MNTLNIITIQQKPALIIDVRMPEEYTYGHIEGSINIPLTHLIKEIPQIKAYSDAYAETHEGTMPTIYVCCASGGRSAIAADVLEQAGIPLVEDGGGWQELSCRYIN